MRAMVITALLSLAVLSACTSATAPTAKDCQGGVMSGAGQC
jgi:hypothetical protein